MLFTLGQMAVTFTVIVSVMGATVIIIFIFSKALGLFFRFIRDGLSAFKNIREMNKGLENSLKRLALKFVKEDKDSTCANFGDETHLAMFEFVDSLEKILIRSNIPGLYYKHTPNLTILRNLLVRLESVTDAYVKLNPEIHIVESLMVELKTNGGNSSEYMNEILLKVLSNVENYIQGRNELVSKQFDFDASVYSKLRGGDWK